MGELVCQGLGITKGAFSLAVPSLRLARGEKVAVLGANGCGKTTLLQSLAGLEPAGGEIHFGALRWDRLSPQARAAYLSYLPQESEVLFNLSVREICELTLYRGKLLRGEERRRVLAATEITELEHRAYPSLSGGEKRRAMLARVFCREADFIFLDEPTAPLDLRHAALLMRHITGVTAGVVAALHDLNLAVCYFDRFLLMKHGRILFDKRKDELESGQLEEIYGIGLARHGDHFVPEP
ncbi:MAG: ABC transporter ATP-binding protein [Deltaproteobacteria bacterium]|nr:ABC transporter ATP-binding protein [Deltaproteobacteria bacterium]